MNAFARSALLGLGLSVPPFALLVLLAGPGSFAPMFVDHSPDYVLGGIAFLGLLVGEVLLLRIARADPEADHHGWRYRDF